MRRTGILLRHAAILFFGFFASGAHAQLTQHLISPPKAMALGNAVTADPPGIMTIQFNPAGLSRLDGRQLEINLTNIYLDIDGEFLIPDKGCDIFGISCAENDPTAGQNSSTQAPALFIPGVGIQRLPELPAALPTGGISFRAPGSKLTFGNAFFLPTAAGFFREGDDPGKYGGKANVLQRITYLSPTVAYQINDEWAVGFGVHLSHQALAADQPIRAPNLLLGVAEVLQDAFNCEEGDEPLAPFLQLCGGNVGPFDRIGALEFEATETVSPTFNIGVMWDPVPWFTWGASYSSQRNMDLKGEWALQYTDDWAGFWQSVNSSIIGAIGAAILSLPSGVPRESGNLTIEQTFPQHFQTGISVDLMPWVTMNADIHWTDWSVFDTIDFQFDRNVEFASAARILAPNNATRDSLHVGFGGQDVWNWGIGFELHASDRLDLRAGFEKRDQAIPESQFSFLAPFGSGNLFSVGFGYQWDKDTVVDAAISYFKTNEFVPADGSCNLNCNNLTNVVFNPFAGLDVDTQITVIQAGLAFRTKF